MRSVLDAPILDPHCGRSSEAALRFRDHERAWTVRWGRYDAFGTPAYWVDQTVRRRYVDRIRAATAQSDLESEMVFCLLGGFGVTAEAAAAAHAIVMPLLKSAGEPDGAALEAALREPLGPSSGRYRFPRQRALRVASAVRDLRSEPIPDEPDALRRRLLRLAGVGPKTSAWIVRNHTGSDEVAIIDIWLVRALTHACVFPPDWRVARDYVRYESAFLSFAEQGDVSPAALDLCVWDQARRAGHEAFLRVD